MTVWRLVVATVAVLLAAAPTARAAQVSLQGDVLEFDAGPGERNEVIVGLSPVEPGWLRVSASPEPVVGSGCERRSFPDGTRRYEAIECRLVADVRTTRVSIALGDRDDGASVYAPLGGVVTGGPGIDGLYGYGPAHGSQLQLLGGRGGDYLTGGRAGTTFAFGGPGDDKMSGGGRLAGGPGDDSFSTYDEEAVMVLGPGRDHVHSEVEVGASDLILARDGDFDVIECGEGPKLDRVQLDELDWSPGCEERQISRSAPARALSLAFSADPKIRQGPGLFVTVGCPIDAPRRCSGTLRTAVPDRLSASRRFRVALGETRVLRVGRTPYCAARTARAHLALRTAPGLRAARMLAATRDAPPRPVDRLRLPDGKRLLVTVEEAPPDYETSMAVLRRYSGCKLDPAFGVDGVLALRWKETVIPPPPRTTYAPGWSQLLHLLQLPSGRIVLGGTHLDYSHHFSCCSATLGLAGITPDGRVDTAFGDDGFAEARFPEQASGGWVLAHRFYAEQDGSGRPTLVLEGGFANSSFDTLPPREPWPAIARFSEDGELIEAHITPPG